MCSRSEAERLHSLMRSIDDLDAALVELGDDAHTAATMFATQVVRAKSRQLLGAFESPLHVRLRHATAVADRWYFFCKLLASRSTGRFAMRLAARSTATRPIACAVGTQTTIASACDGWTQTAPQQQQQQQQQQQRKRKQQQRTMDDLSCQLALEKARADAMLARLEKQIDDRANERPTPAVDEPPRCAPVASWNAFSSQ